MNSLGTTSRRFCLIIPVALFIACAPPSVDPVAKPARTAKKAPAQIDLPSMIRLEGTIPPETHPDHTLRVDGLLARRKKHLGKKVLVRGFLVAKYECPKKAERCEAPHIWIHASPAGGDKKLLVVGFLEETVAKLVVGEQYVVTGNFIRRSPTGFTNSQGLVDMASIEGPGLKERVESQRAIAEKERAKPR